MATCGCSSFVGGPCGRSPVYHENVEPRGGGEGVGVCSLTSNQDFARGDAYERRRREMLTC